MSLQFHMSPNPGYRICSKCMAQVDGTYSAMKTHTEYHENHSAPYSKGADGNCRECGATVKAADFDKHGKWHKEIREAKDMSGVRWCDEGEHAFKNGAPGSASYTMTMQGPNGPEIMERDTCREHNPMRADRNVVAKELEAAYPIPSSGVPLRTDEERRRDHPSAY